MTPEKIRNSGKETCKEYAVLYFGTLCFIMISDIKKKKKPSWPFPQMLTF